MSAEAERRQIVVREAARALEWGGLSVWVAPDERPIVIADDLGWRQWVIEWRTLAHLIQWECVVAPVIACLDPHSLWVRETDRDLWTTFEACIRERVPREDLYTRMHARLCSDSRLRRVEWRTTRNGYEAVLTSEGVR